MKYSNWSQIFANDPNSDSYYKNAVDVSNLTINTIPAEKCIENIKKEPNLMYLSVEPITKAVQIIHHLTAIRGNIAMPETALVAISGFFSSPLAVCLNPKIFNVTKEFEVPSWANITGLVNSANVATTTTNTRNIKMESCCMITLLPFLAKQLSLPSRWLPPSWLSSSSPLSKYLTQNMQLTLHFHHPSIACRRILYFLWAAYHDKIPVIFSVPQSNGIAKKFLNDLTEKHILSNNIAPPNSNNVAISSDATLNSLSGNIHILTNRLETDSMEKKADKDDKKDKFKKLLSSSQQTFIFAFAFSANSEILVLNFDLEAFLQQTTLYQSKTHLNQVLSSLVFQIDARSILVAAIMAGDLIWIKTCHLPKNFTIFLMGKPSGSKSMSQRDWLKLHLQETNSHQLDDSIIDKLSDFKFDYPKSLHDLRHFVNNLVGMCRLLFFKDSAITLQTSSWIDHIDQKEMLYKIQFDIDPLFGLKICLTVNRAIQLFLTSFQESQDLDKVMFRYLHSSFDQ